MDPRELNATVAGICNLLYTKLPRRDFIFVRVLLSELSKSMFAMEILREVCEQREDRKDAERLP